MGKLPRILVVSNYNDPITPIRPEAEIFIGLLELGFDVTVMTEKGSHYQKLLSKNGAHLIDYKPTSKLDLRAMKLIRECVRNKAIDIVHAFNSKSIAVATLALWNVDVQIVGYRGYTGNINWYDLSLYLTFLSPRLNYMVCLAESVREMFIRNGMPKRKAITINKGHKSEWYDDIEKADLSEFEIPDEALVFSLVANNRTKMKGIHVLVQASALLPKDVLVRFLMIGSGINTPEIKELIQNTPNPERFIFTGFRNNASSIVKACDASISASLFGEATQKAMIEAMYLANPVIITDIPGNRNMAVDGKGGLVVAPNKANELCEAIQWMVDHREQLPAMGAKAKEHVSNALGNEKTVKEYAQFYRRISASSAKPSE